MIVQSPFLGTLGRFANWLIQYAMSVQFASRNGATLQTPQWIGERFFNIANERIANPVAMTHFDEDGSFERSDVIALDMFYNLPRAIQPRVTRESIKKMFSWRPQFDPSQVPVYDVVVHNRTGDFVESSEWPQMSLADQLIECKRFGFTPQAIHVVSDSIPPQQSVYPKQIDYLYDFQLMCVAKHLFVYPGSTFSLMASKFNPNRIYSPSGYTNGPTKATYVREICQDQ